MPDWNESQIIALAPDDASVKAGRALATASKWVSFGTDNHAVWGECQGSGKNPYQVSIDLKEIAFKCSCPSRKFPCKHGLGLFFLFIKQQFSESVQPAWCAEWIAKREQAKEKKEQEKIVELTPEALEKQAKAKEKRVAERHLKVSEGLASLEVFLRDVIRNGFMSENLQDAEVWQNQARRLIDAQCPNLDRLLREAAYVALNKEENWANNLLERLSKLFQICDSYKRINELPASVQADLRTVIGFTVKESELENQPTVKDIWQVVGQISFDEDKLRVLRIWLRGKESGQNALILSFAAPGQGLRTDFAVGTEIEAELVFYPSNFPQRAIVKNKFGESQRFVKPNGYKDIDEFVEDYGEALARNPWLQSFPVTFSGVVPVEREEDYFLRDSKGKLIPIGVAQLYGGRYMGMSGGNEIAMMGEWDGKKLYILSAWSDDYSEI